MSPSASSAAGSEATALPVPRVRPRPHRGRQAHGGPPAHRRVLLAQLQLAGQRRVRCRHVRPPVAAAGRRPDAGRLRQAGCRLRVLRQAGHAVLLLPRRRHGARGRVAGRQPVATSTCSVDRAAEKMAETGVRLLWGTANLFSHPRYAAGAATNPDPDVFAHAAAQVRHMLDATHRLGGAELRAVGRPRGIRDACSTPGCGTRAISWPGS